MRSVNIKEVIDALERFAPLPLQEDYDNAGLQVGLTEVEVSGALLCLDITEKIISEAIERKCNLIVAHHPLIFRKLAQVSDKDYVQRIVMQAIKHDITIVAMHTNLDAARGGVNYKMAEKLNLSEVRFFGKRKFVQDDNRSIEGGEGVIGTLPEPMSAEAFIGKLKSTFQAACVQTNELLKRDIKTVALCGGSGAFLLQNAISEKADAFITGEMHYHDFFGQDQEIQLCAIGHYESEQYTSEILRNIIEKECKGVRCYITQRNTNPILYF